MPLSPLDATNARRVLGEACRQVGLPSEGADLVRLGENVVYRLRGVRVIARIARDTQRLTSAERQLVVASWLARLNVPAVRAWPVAQPVVAFGRVVVFWESVSDEEGYGTTTELGQILHRLHTLDQPELDLPAHDPFDRARRRLMSGNTLANDDQGFLLSRLTNLRARYEELDFVLPRGPIHDDANVGNLLRDRDGRGVLSDLDSFCVGPREWDLIQTAIFYDRFGWHTVDEYDAFVAAYGYDIRQWSGYQLLGDIRELLMVSWLSQNAAPSSEPATELARRIKDLRTDASRQGWRPL